MSKDKTAATRVANMRKRRREDGDLVQVTVWIPKDKRRMLLELADSWRDQLTKSR